MLNVHREYFEDVDRTWETFEKTLWGHISNFYKLSKERYVYFISGIVGVQRSIYNFFFWITSD